MNLIELLECSQVVTDCVLDHLDAKSLALLGACNRYLRSLTNSELAWHRLCKLEGYTRFRFLSEQSNHPYLPAISSTSPSPIYFQFDTETLEQLNEWREIYNRAEHLKFNWCHGIYFVLPLLKEHRHPINAFDSNGTLIATGSDDDRLIKIWSVEDCECVNTIKSRAASVNCLKLYGGTVIAAGDDGIIRIYDQSEGDLLFTLVANNINANALDLLVVDDKVIVVFSDATIRVWSLLTYDSLYILRGHQDEIEKVYAHGNILISGGWDNSLIVWNLRDGQKLTKLEGHTEVINDVKMSGSKIVSASSDGTLRLWTIEIESVLEKESKTKLTVALKEDPQILEGHSSDIYCVQVNNGFICSGGADSTIIVWSFISGELLHRMDGHLGIVRSLHMDEFKLVSAGDAKKIMVWDYKNGKLLNQVHRNPNKINSMIVTDTNIIAVSPEVRNDFFDISIITYW